MSTTDEPKVGSARTATDRPDARTPEVTEPNAAEKVAAPTGAAAGALAAGTAGTIIAGPVGAAVGAIAGAVGGWWAGSGVHESARMSTADESYYRTHYEASAPAGGSWERARPVYHLGHIAAANPAYRGRSFAEIEPDLQRGWTADSPSSPGEWQAVRDLARCAYEHRVGSTRADTELANPGGRTEGARQGDARVNFGPHSPGAPRRDFRGNP